MIAESEILLKNYELEKLCITKKPSLRGQETVFFC